MKAVGGFLELELSRQGSLYHHDALALTSGRSCLRLILQEIKPTKLYLPYYICDAALIPIKENNIHYEFYSINQSWIPRDVIALKDNEFILVVNYFGLMEKEIDELYARYGHHLIIDNTQAFFSKQYKDCWSFNSARKFFGVADGGYLYAPKKIAMPLKHNEKVLYQHLVARLSGNELAYSLYLESEAAISSQVLKVSTFSERLLANIDYEQALYARTTNFAYYTSVLTGQNQLYLENRVSNGPLCYPLLLDKPISRADLSQQGLFIPTFWPEIDSRSSDGFHLEKKLSRFLLPLPIDHRYNAKDCETVVKILSSFM